jgi:hypothetical protein
MRDLDSIMKESRENQKRKDEEERKSNSCIFVVVVVNMVIVIEGAETKTSFVGIKNINSMNQKE